MLVQFIVLPETPAEYKQQDIAVFPRTKHNLRLECKPYIYGIDLLKH